MAKDIVCTFASSQSITSSKEVAKVFGVDRIINIKKASERWLLLDTSSPSFWTDYKRVKRLNSLF
jgi:hypothetical protein